jgi:hypothetical protein
VRPTIVLALLAAACALPAQAQDPPAEGLAVWTDTLDVSEPRLRPFARPETLTLRLDGEVLDSTQYTLDVRTGRLELHPPPPAGAVLTAAYRTLPFEGLARSFALREVHALPDDTTGRRTVTPVTPAGAADPVFGDLGGLRRSGAIRRGVVAGNRRDVSLESGMRLELEGELARACTFRPCLPTRTRRSSPRAPPSG